MTGHKTSFMVRTIFKSRDGLLSILIGRRMYSYEVGFEYILEFEKRCKRNQGQALSYLKQKCMNYWEGGPYEIVPKQNVGQGAD